MILAGRLETEIPTVELYSSATNGSVAYDNCFSRSTFCLHTCVLQIANPKYIEGYLPNVLFILYGVNTVERQWLELLCLIYLPNLNLFSVPKSSNFLLKLPLAEADFHFPKLF